MNPSIVNAGRLLTTLLVLAASGCGPAHPAREYGYDDPNVPDSADFSAPPMRPWSPNEPLRYFEGFCPDHGKVTGLTNDRPATDRAIAAHNARHHQGQDRAINVFSDVSACFPSR